MQRADDRSADAQGYAGGYIMARVKTGIVRRQHHKKVLKITKGQFGSHRLFRRANEAMLKSLWYAYRDAAPASDPALLVDRPHQRSSP